MARRNFLYVNYCLKIDRTVGHFTIDCLVSRHFKNAIDCRHRQRLFCLMSLSKLDISLDCLTSLKKTNFLKFESVILKNKIIQRIKTIFST